ncbi:hypothetical protein BN2475_110001 [Paraburkholderia ribeironis]|uniref:Uncharacterized protein n=1 Tax=Paraburkholderia ribeironis TaxID=1247936 RepID=A0A1N7RQC3_9BURK|nr:hypothetical protein BN2475_110001 [Paraburkholderia ribeironis]
MQAPSGLARISLFRAPETGARGSGKASSGKAFGGAGRAVSQKKPVDGVAKVLHNSAADAATQTEAVPGGG